jgi:IPT/TIG domain-containing protein
MPARCSPFLPTLGRIAATLALLALASCAQSDKKGPQITELKPTVGPYYGGDPVVISGSGFQTPTPQSFVVYFGKKKAKAIILSDREIRAEPPAGEQNEVVDVEIVFDDARVGKMPKAYKYIDPIGKPDEQAGGPPPK